jgi:hypothetical protein
MLLVFSLLVASASVSQAPPTDTPTRACKAIAGEGPGKPKPPRGNKKPGKQEAPAVTPSCVETRLPALDIQEYLQKFVRERQWSARDEHAGEDGWTFSISLDQESLAGYTKPFVDKRIHWRSGRGRVQVWTTAGSDGYTQVIIKAKFDGFGESEDMLATRRGAWQLESNGNLESELIRAIELHSQSSHGTSQGPP